MCFLPSYLLEPYEKLLTPEARKLLEQQALDCLKNAKTEADRKEWIVCMMSSNSSCSKLIDSH
ncbi:hypothetical protein C2R69_07515 [Helicobacter pylori]|nr:CagY family CD-EC repeat-containing protein [Helicobacter pylori]MBH0280540.1 hypothetical protein [Helicobacter pylori]MBH0302697.1 hypothetical protein [Helicobacter pylori]PUD71044.1 hypothetical protein C2R69_07515 [Helicobacter pylori]